MMPKATKIAAKFRGASLRLKGLAATSAEDRKRHKADRTPLRVKPLRGRAYLVLRSIAGKRNGSACDQRTRHRVNLLGFRFSFYVFLFTEFLSDSTTTGAQRIGVWGLRWSLPHCSRPSRCTVLHEPQPIRGRLATIGNSVSAKCLMWLAPLRVA